MLIQVDVDSTLYDADPLFGRIAEEMGIKWPYGANSWLPAHKVIKKDGTPCKLDDLKKVFRKAHSAESVRNNKPYKGAADVLQRIAREYDHVEIAYVSDRNEQQTTALRNWLEENGFLSSPDQHVVATKDKRDWMRERRPSVVIDDRVRTILMARYELGAKVVTLKQPHNVNLTGEADGIYVVDNWDDIYKTLVEDVLPAIDPISRELTYTR